MVRAIDHGKGWQLVEAPITVTLRRQSDGGSQTVTHVAERAATLEDFAEEPAMLEQETRVFHLWQDKLGGTIPAKGDRITKADGTSWHVFSRETQNHARKYRLTCFLEHSP